jgi:FXSXX-COOH protein
MVMVADDQVPEVASDLQDLRSVPLTEIAESAIGADSPTRILVERILAERSSHHVPVAAFNSSI